MQLCPIIKDLGDITLTQDRKGSFYLQFKEITFETRADREHLYAIRTGDTSFHTDTELAAYEKLLEIYDTLQLNNLSDIDKITAVHDYLLLNTAYDETFTYLKDEASSHYVEGTLLHNLAVCSGYASTFQLLMKLSGITCHTVTTDSHEWNLLQLDGNWYHIDVTWDDPVPDREGRLLYTYFMVPTSELSQLDPSGTHENWNCECGTNHLAEDSSYRIYP